jgi:hypothetical protein
VNLKQINEARYAAQRNFENLLSFFEEVPNVVREHQTFHLREGLVCYLKGEEVFEIQNQNGTYVARVGGSLREIDEIESIYVYKLDRLF